MWHSLHSLQKKNLFLTAQTMKRQVLPLVTVAYAGAVIGLAGADEVGSARCCGAAADMAEGKRPLAQAKPLTVKMVHALEQLVADSRSPRFRPPWISARLRTSLKASNTDISATSTSLTSNGLRRLSCSTRITRPASRASHLRDDLDTLMVTLVATPTPAGAAGTLTRFHHHLIR